MMQYSCDLCGRVIPRERYEAKVEIAAAFDTEELTEEDLDADHLQSIADALELLEASCDFEATTVETKTLRFDLCVQCMKRFARDPLGRESLQRLNFSQN